MDDSRWHASRRAVLRCAGRVGVAAAGGAPVVASRRGAADHFESVAGVSRSFDETLLDDVRPLLDVRDTDGVPKLYGFVARKDGERTTACVYFAEWTRQQGVSTADSHLGDHEPLYVFADEEGDPTAEEVVYSGYHWLAASVDDPATDGDGHPTFGVVAPWHHYVHAPNLDAADGSLLDVRHLSDDLFAGWLDQGFEDDLEPGAVLDPWTMRRRAWWWRDTVGGVSLKAWWQLLRFRAGRDGADQTDL